MTVTHHPARYSTEILAELRVLAATLPGPILDPFAGTGLIHALGRPDTIGVEIEPPGTPLHTRHPRTVRGDATRLPLGDGSVGAVVTSPAYGNRMADAYDGRDGSRRHTYRIAQGAPLHARSGAGMQWGEAYRALHTEAWAEAWRVLRPGGRLVLNMSDHIRDRRRVEVTAWHVATLIAIGFDGPAGESRPVRTRRLRHGANATARVDGEALIVFDRPAVPAAQPCLALGVGA